MRSSIVTAERNCLPACVRNGQAGACFTPSAGSDAARPSAESTRSRPRARSGGRPTPSRPRSPWHGRRSRDRLWGCDGPSRGATPRSSSSGRQWSLRRARPTRTDCRGRRACPGRCAHSASRAGTRPHGTLPRKLPGLPRNPPETERPLDPTDAGDSAVRTRSINSSPVLHSVNAWVTLSISPEPDTSSRSADCWPAVSSPARVPAPSLCAVEARQSAVPRAV